MDSTVPASVVIGQDNDTEIHVQPLVGDDGRHLDIRIWRRGTVGFAPSRNALVIRPEDMASLQQGIAELLEASDGGRQAARIVWDDDDTRRLRAETEPFGTRYLASLAFWQRVRDTWKAADDGLVLAADRLEQLQDVLARMRPWMDERPTTVIEPAEDALQRHALYGWPSPGADWLTVSPGSIAFHPRGIRITCTVAEDEDGRRIVLRPWRRIDSLWVPEDTELVLSIVELDALLFSLAELLEGGTDSEGVPATSQKAGAGLVLTVDRGVGNETLTLQQHREDFGDAPQRMSFPYAYAPRFGRMLLHAGLFLAARMSAEERDMLQSGTVASPSVVAYDSLPEAIRYEATHGPFARHGDADELHSDNSDAPGGYLRGEGQPEEEGGVQVGVDANLHELEPTEEVPTVQRVTVSDVTLGSYSVAFSLRGGQPAMLELSWHGQIIALPTVGLAQFAADVRTLYYDALRGRRGQTLQVATDAPVTVSIDNEGTGLYCTLESGEGTGHTRLHFPANQVPVFLDAMQAVLAQLVREITT